MFYFDKKFDPASPQLKNVRIRYSLKNTLVTIKNGNNVFWGISRANDSAGDLFRKSTGRFIAYQRALKAQKENVFGNHETGLRGLCDASQLKRLLDHFDNVKEISLKLIEIRKNRLGFS